jgi:hypothetical protein
MSVHLSTSVSAVPLDGFSVKFDIWDLLMKRVKLQIWLKSDKNKDTLHRPYFVKRVQPTKYQYYSRSKKVVPFYKRQILLQVGYPPPVLVILADAAVICLHTIQDR